MAKEEFVEQRFTERSDLGELMKAAPDFVRTRKRRGITPIQVIYFFVFLMLGTSILAYNLIANLLDAPIDAPPSLKEISMTLHVVEGSIALGIVLVFVIIYKFRALILATEFQSLLFASSAGVHSEFFLILNQDKTVVHKDLNFTKLFYSEQQLDDFEKLTSSKGLKQGDRDKIINAVVESHMVKVPFTLTTMNGDKEEMEITVNPLSRPSGFSVVKGYKV